MPHDTMPTWVQWPSFTINGPPESPLHESRAAWPAQIILNRTYSIMRKLLSIPIFEKYLRIDDASGCCTTIFAAALCIRPNRNRNFLQNRWLWSICKQWTKKKVYHPIRKRATFFKNYFRVSFPSRWLCQPLHWIVGWCLAVASKSDEQFGCMGPENPSLEGQHRCTKCAYRTTYAGQHVSLSSQCVELRWFGECYGLPTAQSIWPHHMHSYWK